MSDYVVVLSQWAYFVSVRPWVKDSAGVSHWVMCPPKIPQRRRIAVNGRVQWEYRVRYQTEEERLDGEW